MKKRISRNVYKIYVGLAEKKLRRVMCDVAKYTIRISGCFIASAIDAFPNIQECQ